MYIVNWPMQSVLWICFVLILVSLEACISGGVNGGANNSNIGVVSSVSSSQVSDVTPALQAACVLNSSIEFASLADHPANQESQVLD